MSAFLSKYGVARHIYIPIVKRAVVDHAVSADWTPSAGDVKISKDGGAAANVTNLPTAIAMGNSTIWDFSLTATEMQAAQIMVTVADSATKAVEDTAFIIETYGNASGQHAVDLSDSVRAGLTALPNAAAAASGGLIINGANAGTVTLGDGLVVNRSSANSDAVSFAGSGTGHGLKVRSGTGATGNGLDVAASSTNGHAVNLAGAGTGDGLKTAGGTTGHGIDAIGGSAAAAGDGIKGSVLGTGVPIRGDITGNVTGNLSGSVGSVTGAVGSVTGAVGSVTGNVGGNVVGSVASVTGNVGGNVVGSVASVTARVTANVDQVDGAALTAHAAGKMPADVLTIAGTAQTAGDVGSKTGFALTAAYDAAKTAAQAGDAMALTGAERTSIAGVINTTAITESYRANGAAPTPAQFMSEVLAHLGESSISGTTKTIKGLDHATSKATFTLDSAVTPASITRAT
jgi:hypothetical protein